MNNDSEPKYVGVLRRAMCDDAVFAAFRAYLEECAYSVADRMGGKPHDLLTEVRDMLILRGRSLERRRLLEAIEIWREEAKEQESQLNVQGQA